MNMKNDNVERIDSVLRNDYDLGFLVDYLEDRKEARKENPKNVSNKPFWLSIVDVLRFIPEFNKEVKRVRRKFQIKPQRLNKELRELLGKDTYNRYFTESQKFARGLYFPDLEAADRMKAVEKKITTWERKKFPTISQEIGRLRLFRLKKLSQMWHEAIKNYVLYEKVMLSLVIFRKQLPQIKLNVDSVTLEPYIEIRVYSHTDTSVFKQRKWLKEMRKKLPNYFNPNRRSTETLLNVFLYFVLKRHIGFTHKKTQAWLETKGLSGFAQTKSNTEIRRFLNLFLGNSN